LTSKAKAKPGELSGGMKRRLSLSRALINQPQMLMLDEPTTGLDPQARHLMWERLQMLMQEGKSILLTSTGFYGQAVSEIDLTLKPSAGLVSASANTVPVIRSVNSNKVAQVAPTGFAVVEKDAAIDALVTNYVNLSKTAGNLVVGSVVTDIKRALLANGKDRDETNESALADVPRRRRRQAEKRARRIIDLQTALSNSFGRVVA
jgi:ABC-type multidrug transport system ATPase subunit